MQRSLTVCLFAALTATFLLDGCGGGSNNGGSVMPNPPSTIITPITQQTPKISSFSYNSLYTATAQQLPSEDPNSIVSACTLADNFALSFQYFQFTVKTITDASGNKFATVSFNAPSPLVKSYGPTTFTDQKSLAQAIALALFTYTGEEPKTYFDQSYAGNVGIDLANTISSYTHI